jgi:hypothetical protein
MESVMCKYIFWEGSIQGLEICVEVYAHNFKEAKNRVMKYISLNRTDKHPIRGIKPSEWE